MSDSELNLEPLEGNELPALYQHAVKTEWGLAIMAWERDGKRAFQFEDGRLRVFKDGYYDKLIEVDRTVNEARDVVADLSRQLGRTENRMAKQESGTPAVALISFDDQLKIFAELYPEGFADKAWVKNVRGESAGRRLKRHRDPAIAGALEKLSKDDIRSLIEKEEYEEVCQRIIDVLSGTDLVSSKRAGEVKALDPHQKSLFAKSAVELMHGDGNIEMRMSRWVRTLRSTIGPTTWQMATILPALINPEEYICVRPSSTRDQAAWMAPRLKLTARPESGVYSRVIEMADSVRNKLKESGLEARDLMDVYDFMWNTLRPAARKILGDDETAAPTSATSATSTPEPTLPS